MDPITTQEPDYYTYKNKASIQESTYYTRIELLCKDKFIKRINTYIRLFLKQVVFKRSGCYNLSGKLYIYIYICEKCVNYMIYLIRWA